VEREYSGPARISGSAGTGKTIVALHRAVFLARANPEARVLLTTFSEPLANALRTRLRRLIANEPRLGDRIDVHSLEAIGTRLYTIHFEKPLLASRESVRDLIAQASAKVPAHKFSAGFLLTEWEQVVDAWQLQTWDAYRDVKRLGRKTRLSEEQRKTLWAIFDHVNAALVATKQITWPTLFTRLATALNDGKKAPFEFVVVDEFQDLSVAQLRFLVALGAARSNTLFFAGDLGQRIFQLPFSWRSLGVDIRGRAHNLQVNYRTSHQIRTQADRLLGPQLADVDENVEDRSKTVSVFNGLPPIIELFPTPASEGSAVAAWLEGLVAEGVAAHEIGVFVRSAAEVARAENAVREARIPFRVLDDKAEPTSGQLAISTMHLAKGLEFRAVAVMACDDEIIPLQARIEAVTEESDLEDVYNTERQLLYVACTRARDRLLVTAVKPGSEFLDDLGTGK
jgi:superfamily I DNA/RNA helicase